MADVQDEIKAYEELAPELEANSTGKWVLVRDLQLVGVYETFDAAAEDAVKKFGRDSYLIRQVGAPPITLPASVMFKLV